jgi:hypothetical protein
MNRKIKNLLIFLIPTIIVVLVSICPYQQNVTATSDDSSDTVIARIELPINNIGANHLPIVFVSNVRYFTPALKSKRNSSIFTLLSKQKQKLINIDNNSPPNNIFG